MRACHSIGGRKADRIMLTSRRLFFNFANLFGFKPWDSGVPPPELTELIEGRDALPAGSALDLGCGTGTNCKYLFEHGWSVTGVDYVGRAIAMARRKAPGAKLLVGDVTRLAELGVQGPFDLMLDLGCFHSIPDAGRDAYVREAARVARAGATLLSSLSVRKDRARRRRARPRSGSVSAAASTSSKSGPAPPFASRPGIGCSGVDKTRLCRF